MALLVRCSNPRCTRAARVEADAAVAGRCPDCGAPWSEPIATEGEGAATLALPTGTEQPKVIGRYIVKRLIGAGAFGKVYHAHDPQLDRDVAIKMLRPDMVTSSQAVERFQREARAAARMMHPHIVPVFDTGQHGPSQFIAQAFIPGSTLAGQIPERGMEPRRAVTLMLQILDALGYAHQQGIQHRDVKPVNIMMAANDHLYLMDFGLAKWVEEGTARLTQEGAILGTPAYMAPEQAEGRADAIGPASDLYAAGVMLYELLTGRLPFEGPTPALLYHVIHSPPPAPTRFRPELDSYLSQVVLKALAKNPTDRFQSAEEFRLALKNWLNRAPTLPLAEETLPIVQPGKPPTTRSQVKSAPRGRGKVWFWGVAGLVLVVAGGIAGWRFWPAPGKPIGTLVAAASNATAGTGPILASTADAPRPSLTVPTRSVTPTTPTRTGVPTAATRSSVPVPTRPSTRPATRVTTPTAVVQQPTATQPGRDKPAEVAEVEAPALWELARKGKLVAPYLEEQARQRLVFWRQRARANDPEAQFVFGLYFYFDVDKLGNRGDALQWFERAAQRQHGPAMYYLYLCYSNGVGTSENTEAAVRWLKQSAEAGYFQAQNMVALRLWNGDDGPADRPAAMEWWNKAVKQSFVVAETNLAIGYLIGGGGVEPNPERAVELLQRAAAAGWANAQYELALCYRDGKGGLGQNDRRLFELAKAAAEDGHEDAMALLGDCFFGSVGVENRAREAYWWYKQAADKGSAAGHLGLGMCHKSGIGVEKADEQAAFRCFREAVKKNLPRAHFELGRCYEFGLGTNEDLEFAHYYYKEAADRGYEPAKRRLERWRNR
ncbi:MAG TPA: protein kinase [Gemmatales bacterium]|nr:protein kinase [Gemmatales bacterium]